jgi:hypothetical protein
MEVYRIYELDSERHSSREPRLVSYKDDEGAELVVRQIINSRALEIRCGKRKVATTIKP